ncbi:MAG: PH domain-containing protein [Dermatophilaceae bacterium]
MTDISPHLPETPEHPEVVPAGGRVELFEGGGLDWRPVSPKLVTARTITLLAWLVPIAVALTVAALTVTSWVWFPAGVVLFLLVWGLWLIRRQVSAMSYIELAEDLVIRKGRVFRQVSSIPFGRLQYVDLQSGPLERKLGMATLQIFTASPSTSATIPGLPIETAEQMRERLMQRGEAQRAGL